MGVFGLLNLHLVALFHLAVNLLTELGRFVLQSSVRKGLTEILFLLFSHSVSPPLHCARKSAGSTCVMPCPGVTWGGRGSRRPAGRDLRWRPCFSAAIGHLRHDWLLLLHIAQKCGTAREPIACVCGKWVKLIIMTQHSQDTQSVCKETGLQLSASGFRLQSVSGHVEKFKTTRYKAFVPMETAAATDSVLISLTGRGSLKEVGREGVLAGSLLRFCPLTKKWTDAN